MEFSEFSLDDQSWPLVMSAGEASFSPHGVTFKQLDSGKSSFFPLETSQVFKIGHLQFLCVSSPSPESEKGSGSLFSRAVFTKFNHKKDSDSFESASRGDLQFESEKGSGSLFSPVVFTEFNHKKDSDSFESASRGTEETVAWEAQFKVNEDLFEGYYFPINFVESFFAAQADSRSMIVGVLIGYDYKRVTHLLLPPQWSTHRQLHISNLPLDNMHLRGMSVLGFVRTKSCADIGLTPTPDDILFFTKYFGEEGVIGICSSSEDMVLYNVTKEAYAWGKSTVDLDTLPPDHCVETKWKTDETTPLFFLVPPIWNYNPNVPSHSDLMPYSLAVSSVPYVKKIKRRYKSKKKYWYA